MAGDTVQVRRFADSARAAFEAQLRATPGDDVLHRSRGLALAYLGQRAAAARDGERGLALAQATGDGYIYIPDARYELARIYLIVGDHPHALAQLDSLLAKPYYVSPAWLKIDPTWATLKGDPRGSSDSWRSTNSSRLSTTDLSNQRHGLACWLDVVLFGEARPETLIERDRSCPVTHAAEQGERLADHSFIEGRECRRAPGPFTGNRRALLELGPLSHDPGRGRGLFQIAGAGEIEPLLELRRLADIEPGQQISAVKLERSGRLSALDCLVERKHVTRQCAGRDPDVLITPRVEHTVPKPATQRVQRLAQRAARMRFIHLGPKQPEQPIASVMTAGLRDDQVGKERQRFGLCQQIRHGLAGRRTQLDASE
jgi:hypothetical protein